MDNDYDSVLILGGRFCSRCDRLKKEYKKISEAILNHDKIKFFFMNTTLNEVDFIIEK